MEKFYEKILVIKNKPLFKNKISKDKHKIFYKYTSDKYFKYIYELLDSLCKKSNYENSSSIFHISLYFILKILYKCGNIPYLNNLDLIVLNCFSLGIKSTIKQKEFPSIRRLKNIYEEKYCNYNNEEICIGEIICLKLLNYNINILTVYEYITYLTKYDSKLKELSLIKLKFIIFNNFKKFIYKSSLDIAKECIKTIEEKIIVKEPKIIKKKIITSNPFNRSPVMKKYLSSDKIDILGTNNKNYNTKSNIIINKELKIKMSNIKKNYPTIKISGILNSKMNLKNSADKIYHKKNCINYSNNNINNNDNLNPISNNILLKEINFDNLKNDKKELFNIKLNKKTLNKSINNTRYENNLESMNKTTDKIRKKIYLSNYNNSNQNGKKRNIFENYNRTNMNNTQYFKRDNDFENESKENDSNIINLYNQRNDIYDNNNYDYNNSNYNSFIKEVNTGILTKSINLGVLTKNINNNNNSKNNSNSNYQRYNILMNKKEKQGKIKSSRNYFNNSNSSHEKNLISNISLASYYIHW